MRSNSITFGSLFAGIGGFDLGFERAGMVCKWQVEIDDYATRVLAKHWPSVHRERDIRDCGPHNLERVDVICGGFPCQDISYAGLGAGLDGERSGLFFEAIRLVRQLQPRFVVLENVAALLTRGLDRVLGTLAEIGFDAEWHCIPAAAVGAPHIRDRVWIVADSSGERIRKLNRSGSSVRFNESDVTFVNGKNVSDSNETDDSVETGKKRTEQEGTRWAESRRVFFAKHLNKYRSDFGARQWGSEPAVGRVANGIPNRAHRLRCLGNAVVPQVAEWIGTQVMEKLR